MHNLTENNEKDISSQLKNICETYIQAEKDFANTISPIFQNILPGDFDLSLLNLEDAMANIIINKNLGAENTCHLIKISYKEYNSNELVKHLMQKDLTVQNGMFGYKNNLFIKNLDGFRIEFEHFNLNDSNVDNRQVNIRIRIKPVIESNDVVARLETKIAKQLLENNK